MGLKVSLADLMAIWVRTPRCRMLKLQFKVKLLLSEKFGYDNPTYSTCAGVESLLNTNARSRVQPLCEASLYNPGLSRELSEGYSKLTYKNIH